MKIRKVKIIKINIKIRTRKTKIIVVQQNKI